jgi:hypothetical protein
MQAIQNLSDHPVDGNRIHRIARICRTTALAYSDD